MSWSLPDQAQLGREGEISGKNKQVDVGNLSFTKADEKGAPTECRRRHHLCLSHHRHRHYHRRHYHPRHHDRHFSLLTGLDDLFGMVVELLATYACHFDPPLEVFVLEDGQIQSIGDDGL